MNQTTSQPADNPEPTGGSGRRIFWVALPVVVFLTLAGFFFVALQSGGPSVLPSTLINRPVPEFSLPPVEGLRVAGKQAPGFQASDLVTGEVTLLNVWASWCVPCRAEHPLLTELAEKHNMKIFGLNFKDKPENAVRFLGTLGNPFYRVGSDRKGKGAIELGVYGIPETFVVDGQGNIRYKIVGQLTPASIERRLKPEIERARQKLPEN